MLSEDLKLNPISPGLYDSILMYDMPSTQLKSDIIFTISLINRISYF